MDFDLQIAMKSEPLTRFHNRRGQIGFILEFCWKNRFSSLSGQINSVEYNILETLQWTSLGFTQYKIFCHILKITMTAPIQSLLVDHFLNLISNGRKICYLMNDDEQRRLCNTNKHISEVIVTSKTLRYYTLLAGTESED